MTKPIQIKSLTIGTGVPKICVPLTASVCEELCTEAGNAVSAGADLVEWRADFYEDLMDIEKIGKTLQNLSDILGQIPLLFTIRTKEEGGSRQIATEDYVNLNLAAAKTGKADLIDVEIFGKEAEKRELICALHNTGVKVIASTHDFAKTDDRQTLLRRFQQMDATGADILKMAVMPHEFQDVATLMQVTSLMGKEYTDKPLISMSMGNIGSISRISGENYGSCITFGTVGAASAPGQFPIKELRMMLEALHEKNQD